MSSLGGHNVLPDSEQIMAKQYFRLIRARDVGKACKGLWIPNEFMFCKELTLIEKVVVSIIKGFTDAGKDCYCTNAFFADVCSCDVRTIRRTLARLKTEKILHSRHKKIDNRNQRVLWIA